MLRVLSVTLALVVLPPGAAWALGSTAPGTSSPGVTVRDGLLTRELPRHVPGQLLVRFKAGVRASARAASRGELGARRLRALPVPGLQVVKLRRGTGVRAAAQALEHDPNVLYAEPNSYYRLSALPNDSRFGELWALNNTGQSVLGAAGTVDADIDAPEAWDITKGSDAVTVAIADSGVAYDHPDLQSNIWKNPGESGAGREHNGRDDDHNGLVDDWHGWDFVSNDNDPRDYNGHGTHVAGTIGARGNNAAGVTGVNWRVKLMALRVADGNGVVTGAAMIAGFDYAASKGARVVNASFGSPDSSRALLDTVRSNPKTLFVAAAGNGGDDGAGDDNDRTPEYPCNFSAPNVICVAASDRADRLASFSNYGARSVDIAAPGVDIASTLPAYTAPIFSEGFENDISATWMTGGTPNSWARTAAISNTGSYSLSDSPGATYLDATDNFAGPAGAFSLSGQSGCRLEYAVRLATEPGPDKVSVEVSRDGVSWVALSELSGSTGGIFAGLSDDLSELDGEPDVRLRYHLTTNGSVVSDGAQLDDIDVHCLASSYGGNELAFMDGTSMATPHVTGAAALILAKYPSLGVAGARSALLRGVDRKSAFAGRTASGGRLNLRKALEAARRLVPRLTVTGAARQRALGTGKVVVYARCSQTCALVATGSLSVSRSSAALRLKKIALSAGAGTRKKLALKLSRRAVGTAKRALARGRGVTAVVTVSAMTSQGNAIKARRTIKLRR
jgi:subtilisin family serine protease